MKERDVLQQCLEYLRLRGIPHWRNNTGALPAGKRYVRFGVPGSSDILGILPGSGRFLAVECKRPGGRVRAAQRAFLDAVTAAGGLSLIVSDVRQLQAALDAEGV